MSKRSTAKDFLRGRIGLARCFPSVAYEVRDLLSNYLEHVPQKHIMLESTAIATFLVQAEVVKFEERCALRNSESVWAFMMCYTAVRTRERQFRVDSLHFEQLFEKVARTAYRMHVHTTAHARAIPPSE